MSVAARSASRSSSTVAGVGFMVLGIFMFSANDAMGKWLVGTFAVGQILLLRSVGPLVILAPFIRREGLRGILLPERPFLHGLRALGSALEVGLFYWALSYLPLANVMTFYLAGPIYVTALSALILKEQVGRVRWAAVFVGFIGVVIAMGPNISNTGWAALIAVGGSLSYALLMILTRVLASSGETTLLTWQILATLIGGMFLAPLNWVAPSASDLVFLTLLGVVSMIAHGCVNRALTIAPAAVVVPYQYTLIVWAIVFGWFFFDEAPGPSLLIGAAVITGSGIFIFLREQNLAKRSTGSIAAGAPDAAIAVADPNPDPKN